MRIAQVAPLYEAVPPLLYGGTERVVAHLTDGLVGRGHRVTLFASGESATTARLEPARQGKRWNGVLARHAARLNDFPFPRALIGRRPVRELWMNRCAVDNL